MSGPMGMGHRFAEDSANNQKWHNKSKTTRIQITLFFLGLAVLAFWQFGYEEVFIILGAVTAIHYTIKLFSEIKTWFKR